MQYSTLALVSISLGLLSAVCAIAGLTRAPAAFSFFYLIPIYFAAWYLPATWSVLFSAATYVAMGFADSQFHPSAAVELLRSPRYLLSLLFFVATAYLLSRLASAYRNERQLSSHDYLTGVFNRREFFHLAEIERLRALRYARAMTLVFLDLDNFKTTNDRYGHAAGDQMLGLVAKTLKDCIRGTDVIARLGGDEFVILLEETEAEPARTIVGKLREMLAERTAQSTCRITASVGVVTFVVPPSSVDEMVKLGDEMMYEAKRQGGDRAIFRSSDGTLEEAAGA